MSDNNHSASKLDKVQQILKALENGVNRDTIAYEMGYTNPKSLDIYMRRKGFLYDRQSSNYIPIRSNELNDTKTFNTTKRINYILSSFSQEEADPKTIAELTGFENHIELADYMKSNGFEWNDRYGNYTKTFGEKHMPSPEEDGDVNGTNDFTEFYIFLPFLRKLYEHKASLLQMLERLESGITELPLDKNLSYKKLSLLLDGSLYDKIENYSKANSIEINALIVNILTMHYKD
jgi:hypothetical protein